MLSKKTEPFKTPGKKSKSLSYTYKIKISINERPLGMVGRRDMFHGRGELGLSPGGCHLVLLLLFKVVEVGGPVFLFTLSPSVMPCQSQTIFTQNSPLLQYVRYYLSYNITIPKLVNYKYTNMLLNLDVIIHNKYFFKTVYSFFFLGTGPLVHTML